MGRKTEAIERAGLAEAVGQAADAIVITGPDGVIQFVNPAFTAMTGYSREEAVGQNPRVLKSGRQSQAFYQDLWDTIRSGRVWQGELVNRRKDGSAYQEEMRIAPLVGPDGDLKGYVAIKRNISERRAADEARRFLAAIVEGSEDAIFSYSTSGAILTWNRGAEAIFGYSSVEAVGKHVSFLVAPEKLPVFGSILERLLKGESVPLRRGMALHKEGRKIPVSITSTSIRDSLGQVIAISDIVRDESMRQKVEDTQALLATVVESSADAIFSTDLDGTILSWNRECELIYGISRQEAIGRNIADLLPSAEQDRAKEILDTVRRGGSVSPFEAVIGRRGGGLTKVSVRVAVIRNAAGEVVGSSSSLTDITERRQAEDALRASEERFRTSFEQAAIGIVHATFDGRYLRCNSRFAEIIGYAPEEIPGMSFRQTTLPEDQAESERILEQVAGGATKSSIYEKRYRRKDGSSTWVKLTVSTQRDGEGRALHLIAVVEDIDARKHAEACLQEATERLSLAARAGGVGIFDYDIVNDSLIWDEQQFRLYGIPRDRFIGAIETWRNGVHPEDRQRGEQEFNAALRGEKDFDTEFRVVWPDGSIHHIRALALVKRDASDKAVRMIGTNWEITAHKRAEAQLRDSEERYRAIFEQAPVGIALVGLDGCILSSNARFAEIVGYLPEEVPGLTVRQVTAPEDLAARIAHIGHIANGTRGSHASEWRYLRKDGSLIWARSTVSLQRDSEGRPLRLIALVEDISARRTAEERYRTIFQTSQDGIAITRISDARPRRSP